MSSLKFNPLLSDTHSNFSLAKDIDPDSNVTLDIADCRYFIEDQFNEFLQVQNIDKNRLSFMHINTRSLQCNLNGVSNLLSNIALNFSFIGISETWLQASDHNVHLPGYNFIHEHRTESSGGGVGLYVDESFEFKPRPDLCFQNKKCAESLFVEVIRPKEKNIVLGVVYRPPKVNLRDFIGNLDSFMAKLSSENKVCYVMADWNLDLMKHHCHDLTGQFLDTMFSRSFVPLITRPTRITSNKATLIDNIFTNDIDNCAASGLFVTDISDHLPIFCLSSKSQSNQTMNKYITFRDKSAKHMQDFKSALENTNWGLSDINDSNEMYNSFLNKYVSIYNACFPLKRVKARKCVIEKPWLTRSLLKSIKRKSILYRQSLQKPSTDRELKYKKYKNKLTQSLRLAKRLYYETKLEECKSNMKSTWRILNEVINRKKMNTSKSVTFSHNNQNISDPLEIANKFCEYFTNIGPNLASCIPNSTRSYQSYLHGNFSNSLFLYPSTEHEILEICSSFRSGTAAGLDNVTMNVIKETASLICSPIVHIFNLSLSSGSVPDQMKCARVIPLFKSGLTSLFTNYRPVSVLPAFSKILEKLVYNRLIKYLEKYDILSSNQYGFRKNHSTFHALVHLYDKISAAIDSKQIALGLFIDLSKAFDTVNHEILLKKLEFFGIRGLALEWFRSYLSGRLQQVQYNGQTSMPKVIRCGVPQGSILGPLLFLIYINDLCQVSNILDMILFADDTNIFYSHKDPNFLNTIVNTELDKLSSWFQANRLSINVKKSNFVIFKSAQNRQNLDFSFFIDNNQIDRVEEVVFLGVILDQNLNWKSHIHNVARKISKSLGIIFKASFCLNEASLRTLYFSLVYPYLCYCVGVWGSTYPSNLKRVVTLQKRAIRIISKSKFDAHTDPLFKELKMLKLDSIIRFHICKLMFFTDMACYQKVLIICFLLIMKFIAIILSRDLVFLYPTVGQILANFLYDSKDLNFSTL